MFAQANLALPHQLAYATLQGHLRQALEFMGARKAAAVAAKLYPPRTAAELPTHEAIQRGLVSRPYGLLSSQRRASMALSSCTEEAGLSETRGHLQVAAARHAKIWNESPAWFHHCIDGLQDQLELSQQQREDLLAARTKLLRKHREIRRERVEIVQRMQVVPRTARSCIQSARMPWGVPCGVLIPSHPLSMQVVIEKDRGAADETTNAGFLLEVRWLVECDAFYWGLDSRVSVQADSALQEVEALEELKRNLVSAVCNCRPLSFPTGVHLWCRQQHSPPAGAGA